MLRRGRRSRRHLLWWEFEGGHPGCSLRGLPFGRLDRRHTGDYTLGVKVRTVSFEALQRDKRRARKRDELRLARGEVTAEQLEVENSFIPFSAKITIQDFSKTLERYYDK